MKLKLRSGMLLLPLLAMSVIGCVPKTHAGSPAASGPALFEAKGCAHCHAINGAGGHKGPDLTHEGLHMKPAEIRTQIMQGGDGMPAYKDVLSPQETKLLVHYLHKLR